MYNGIGLQTARGSGTNGYVQTNKFFVRPRTNPKADNSQSLAEPAGVRKANKEILEHDRKRQIELQVLVLQEKLEEQGYTDDEITEKVAEIRKELEMEHLKSVNSYTSSIPSNASRFSDTQTHQVAARKEKQLEIMRAALNIKSSDEANENLAQDQKPDNEAPISDNDERNNKNQLKKRESDDYSSSDIEEGEFVKTGNQVAEDFISVKESKRDAKDVGRKKGDGKTKPDYSSDSYSSDENGKRRAINDTKKRRRHDTESESDSDLNIKRSREQQVRHKRSYSDDSDSDGYNQKKSKEKIGHKRDSYNEKLSAIGMKKYDKYSKKEIFEEERSRNYHRYNKREDSEEEQSKKYTRYGKREDSDEERSKKYDRHSTRKDSEERSKRYDKYSKREDSEEERSESEDEKRSKRKELEKSNKSTGKIHDTSRRDSKLEKNNRNSEVAHTKLNKEVNSGKREDSDEERSKKYARYGKSGDSEEERSKKYDKHSTRKNSEEQSKRYDKYSKREDSEEERSESEDEEGSKRKPLEKSSKSTGKIHDTSGRDSKLEKNNRNSEVANAKLNKEANRSKRNQHDTDDDSLDSKEDMRTIKGKKPYKKSSSSSSSSESESESESSDTASGDSRYKRRTDRISKPSSRDSEAKRESKVNEPKVNDRYKTRRNDIDSSRSQDGSRKRVVEESAASKEKERQRDNRYHDNRGRPSKSRRVDNKEKQVAEEEQNNTERGSRKRSNNEERYDDKKTGRYDSYDRKYKEDSGLHRRR